MQTLDGKLSVEFLRTIQPGGDTARLRRQNLYTKALQIHLMDASILAKVPKLYKSFDKAVFTDLSPKQIESLACMTKEVPQDQIRFYEIGGDLVTVNASGALVPDVEKIKAKLKEWLGE